MMNELTRKETIDFWEQYKIAYAAIWAMYYRIILGWKITNVN